MPTLSGNFNVNTETSNVVQDLVDLLYVNWSVAYGGVRPNISTITNYRSVDLYNNEYVIVSLVEDYEDYSGVGGIEFKRRIVANVKVFSDKSGDRAIEILDECRRIFRLSQYWGSFKNVLLSTAVDLSESYRKVYSFNFVVTAERYEAISV